MRANGIEMKDMQVYIYEKKVMVKKEMTVSIEINWLHPGPVFILTISA